MPYIEGIIIKYLTRSISSGELDHLISWLEKKDNQRKFRSFIRTNYAISYTMGKYDSDKAKKQLLQRIQRDKRSFRRGKMAKLLKYAAIALFFLVLGALYKEGAPNQGVIPSKPGGEDRVTLELEDGRVKVLSGQDNSSILDNEGERIGLQNGNQLIYHRTSKGKRLVYNTLNVPFGKRFMLILSDGSKVHLNSGSTLRYPAQFVKGKKRLVFLEGEAFFDVAKDNGQPFVVKAEGLNIKVLGTQFNLSAYKEDVGVKTVLVEGSVGFFRKDEDLDAQAKEILTPGFMATFQKGTKDMVFDEVDTSLYTGWMDGKVIFSHMPFKEILKRLERNYDITILNKNKALEGVRFTASFDTETITDILEAFKKSYPLDFRMQDDTHIIIEEPKKTTAYDKKEK
ncbi:MAG: FecR domain-containing protein [Bacteroidota bacterium]